MKIGNHKLHLIERTEPIDGIWGYWSCEIEDENGNLTKGEIQSDGHLFAEETLVDEDGNTINIISSEGEKDFKIFAKIKNEIVTNPSAVVRILVDDSENPKDN